jgi:hypothetical protein
MTKIPHWINTDYRWLVAVWLRHSKLKPTTVYEEVIRNLILYPIYPLSKRYAIPSEKKRKNGNHAEFGLVLSYIRRLIHMYITEEHIRLADLKRLNNHMRIDMDYYFSLCADLEFIKLKYPRYLELMMLNLHLFYREWSGSGPVFSPEKDMSNFDIADWKTNEWQSVPAAKVNCVRQINEMNFEGKVALNLGILYFEKSTDAMMYQLLK